MGNDLTGMIEEINDASSSLSKNSKADDPVRYPFSIDSKVPIANLTHISSHKSSASSTATLLSSNISIKVPLPYNQKSKKPSEQVKA